MKKIVFAFVLMALYNLGFSQVFWTENFGTGCNQNHLANGSNSGNGIWTVTNTGTNQSAANQWYVSATEGGVVAGNCGEDGCSTGTNSLNRTLHVGNVASSPLAAFSCPTGDCGAAYDAGLGTSQVTTNRRAESPTINCSGQNNITLTFDYIMEGDPGNDFATIMYFDGTTWSTISTPAATNNGACAGQGLWTTLSIPLPATANNNASVKVGFNWTNNDDGVGTDPSFAVDNVKLSASATPTSAISFTLPSPVCELATINAAFTSTVPTTFSWTASSANVVFTPPNSGTTTISFTGPGTYTINLTATQGTVSATGSATIQVLPTPTVNVTASPTVVCGAGSSTVVASGGTTYTWTASTGPNPPNTATVVVSPTVTTTYTVLTSIPGCTSGTIFNIPVAPQPTITVTPNQGICSGQNASLVAGGGASYTWTPSSSLSSSSGSNVTATPTVNTTYTVIGSNGTCTNSAVTTVTVGPSASVSVTPTSTTICSGQSAVLNATSGSTYTWTASSGTNPPGVASVTVSPTTPTTYTVMTGSGNCTATAVASVSVAPAINLTVTPSNTTICSGGSGTSITASGATNYSWTPGTGLSGTSGPNVTANPSSTTNYTVIGSNSSCTVTSVATVSVVNVSLTVTPTSGTYCAGGTPVSLTASGATSYSWSPATGLSSTSTANTSASPTVTTTYTVTGTTGSCISTKTVMVTVMPPTTVTVVSSGTNICQGTTTATLTATGAATYSWAPGTGLSATTGSVVIANPSTTTTYSVAGLTAGGCVVFPAVITVSVLPAVTPTITAASPSVCLGSTVALTASPTGAGFSYTWTPATAILGASNTASVTAKPTTTSTVVYTVAVNNGQCTGKGTFSLVVHDCIPPTAGFTTSTEDSICVNGCVTFSNTSVSTGTPTTYQWAFPGGTPPTSNAANPQVCYSAPGDYTVGLVVTNPYGSDTLVIDNFIDVAITPTVTAFGDTTVRVGQTATITATGGLTYNWTPSTWLTCPTCSVTAATPTVTTMYIVTGYNSPHCFSSDTVIVKVDFICGDFFIPNAFSPNNDGLNDYVNIHGFCVGTFNLQIFDRWGEKVFETTDKTVGWDGSFRGKPMDTGVFVYRVDGITIDGKPFSLKGNITLIR
ncbi:MAG: gliding motility-associated C-terminal domain-containing protein [Bacteroidetes bacterium]|nr:gliding motility-associated C-terminal domain-containing protein [Bacteroidota bacterium]